MEFFAIRHKPSGYFLPAYAKRHGRTNAEPTDALAPRLFMKAHHAKAALDWWLLGVVTLSYRTDWESGYTETRGLDIEPRADRKADDMEVVAITLTTKEN